jgi:hypothetical protein
VLPGKGLRLWTPPADPGPATTIQLPGELSTTSRWGARPPRALLDAPRVQPFLRATHSTCSELFGALDVFREGAEHGARGRARSPFNFGFRVENLRFLADAGRPLRGKDCASRQANEPMEPPLYRANSHQKI